MTLQTVEERDPLTNPKKGDVFERSGPRIRVREVTFQGFGSWRPRDMLHSSRWFMLHDLECRRFIQQRRRGAEPAKPTHARFRMASGSYLTLPIEGLRETMAAWTVVRNAPDNFEHLRHLAKRHGAKLDLTTDDPTYVWDWGRYTPNTAMIVVHGVSWRTGYSWRTSYTDLKTIRTGVAWLLYGVKNAEVFRNAMEREDPENVVSMQAENVVDLFSDQGDRR